MSNDKELRNNVLEELDWRPFVNGAHIGVTARNNVVTLTGEVSHYAENRRRRTQPNVSTA